jgi:cell fate regulator YaaT (PSP1 superfamily)
VPDIVSIVFRSGGRVYQFDAAGLDLAAGDHVVVETNRGADIGTVVRGTGSGADTAATGGLKRVRRRATDADLERLASNRAAEDEAKGACRDLVRELGLDMKVVAAEQPFEGGKLTVTFFAEERVDFRELLGKLSDRLGRRVELKQIGARDEARAVGGFGPCGRSLCCATFAGDQQPVSIRMAKDQGLPLNPTKISGCCGRLMCCLKYEHSVYVSFRQEAPRRGAVVSTPAGEGKVVELLAPAESVTVDLGEGRFATYKLSDLGREGGKKE